MTTRSRKLRDAGSIVFAPPAAGNHPLKVTQFRAWRVKEPVSNRRYTVVRLQSGNLRICRRRRGRYPLHTKAGLGVDINEEALKRYPFQGTRPFAMAFQEDGALTSI